MLLISSRSNGTTFPNYSCCYHATRLSRNLCSGHTARRTGGQHQAVESAAGALSALLLTVFFCCFPVNDIETSMVLTILIDSCLEVRRSLLVVVKARCPPCRAVRRPLLTDTVFLFHTRPFLSSVDAAPVFPRRSTSCGFAETVKGTVFFLRTLLLTFFTGHICTTIVECSVLFAPSSHHILERDGSRGRRILHTTSVVQSIPVIARATIIVFRAVGLFLFQSTVRAITAPCFARTVNQMIPVIARATIIVFRAVGLFLFQSTVRASTAPCSARTVNQIIPVVARTTIIVFRAVGLFLFQSTVRASTAPCFARTVNRTMTGRT